MSVGNGGVVVSQSVSATEVRLDVKGELDAASASDIVGAVELLQPLTAPVTLGLRDVTFIDSAGLRALLTVRERAEADTGMPLRLDGLRREHLKLLELCGLLDAFDLEQPEA